MGAMIATCTAAGSSARTGADLPCRLVLFCSVGFIPGWVVHRLEDDRVKAWSLDAASGAEVRVSQTSERNCVVITLTRKVSVY
jgi:hypothetical protein